MRSGMSERALRFVQTWEHRSHVGRTPRRSPLTAQTSGCGEPEICGRALVPDKRLPPPFQPSHSRCRVSDSIGRPITLVRLPSRLRR